MEPTGRVYMAIPQHRFLGNGGSDQGALWLLANVGAAVLRPLYGPGGKPSGLDRLAITPIIIRRARVGAMAILTCATAPLWMTSVSSGCFAVVASAGAAYALPPLLTGADRRRLSADIQKFLPEAIEMLVVGVQAGIAFDRTMRIYCEHFGNRVAMVFSVILENVELGMSRPEALAAARAAVNDEVFSNWAESVERAERLGTPLAPTMAAQARETRRRRGEWVETQAAKAPVKMLFPMVVLVMPALFVVLLGPVLIKMFQGQF